MAGAGKVTLIGIRKAESSRRKKRNEVEISSRKYSGTLEGLDDYRAQKQAKRSGKSAGGEVNITNDTEETTVGCIHGKESLLISPIIHWTERDVWEFLDDVVRVPHCVLYDQGWRRIGCIGCPMSSARQKRMENERWPHVKRNWIKAIKAIRAGGVFKREYVWRNIPDDLTPCRNIGSKLTRGRLSGVRTQDVSSTANGCKPRPNSYQKDIWGCPQQKRVNTGLWAGFPTAPRLAA